MRVTLWLEGSDFVVKPIGFPRKALIHQSLYKGESQEDWDFLLKNGKIIAREDLFGLGHSSRKSQS